MNDKTYSINYNFNYKNPIAPSFSRIILVGTAHVSEKSIAEVNEVIDREKPDIIAVELDKGRFKALKGEEEVKDINVKDLLSQGNFYFFLLHWLLAYVQKKIGADTGVKPGAEMLSAIEKAEKTGAQVALIDRDIQITLGRFWKKMSFFEKLKLFGSLVGATAGIGTKDIDMDTVTDEDVVSQLIEELRKIAPSAASVLLDERNAIMARNLIDLSKGNTVVAVVGAGHRTGIQKYLDAPDTIPPTQELMSLPKKGFSWFKAVIIAFSAMIVGMLGLLVLGGYPLEKLLTAMLYLFVAQGILSAVGVLVARGHPLSALTAFGLAWFGFLHPFLAVGWLAGIVEMHFRPPTTDDFKNIMKTETMNELMKNKLFHIMLVVGLANLGSMIGTFVAIPYMVHYMSIDNPVDILTTALSTGYASLKTIL
ncbi:MAG: TraB/GumN family protein [Candidatus Methanoperedens sp.]|nr:TraB/GumN family protein [Candidatus Methanoperedens sp.]MCE8429676.1 TraB/GumN family protein [Candidatus Methanoperedens sp.]